MYALHTTETNHKQIHDRIREENQQNIYSTWNSVNKCFVFFIIKR